MLLIVQDFQFPFGISEFFEGVLDGVSRHGYINLFYLYPGCWKRDTERSDEVMGRAGWQGINRQTEVEMTKNVVVRRARE